MRLLSLLPFLAWASDINPSDPFEELLKDSLLIIDSSKPMEEVSPILAKRSLKCENLKGGGYIAWNSGPWSHVHSDCTPSSQWVVLKKRADPDTYFLAALHDEPKDDQYESVKYKLMGKYKPSSVTEHKVKRIK